MKANTQGLVGTPSSSSPDSGMAMVSVLVTAAGLAGLVYVSTMISGIELTDARRGLDEVSTVYVAQAGIERSLQSIRSAMKKTAVVDPLLGVKNMFKQGGTKYQKVVLFQGEPVTDGVHKAGEFTVSMTAADSGNGLDVTISSTGYFPNAPGNGRTPQVVRAIQATVHLSTRPARVFDSAYFINNWGWLYGSTIYCNGNAASNGQFDCGGYAPTIAGQPTYGGVTWTGSKASLTDFQDDNGDNINDGNDGGVFSGWDIVGVDRVVGNGGKKSNQHDFRDRIDMPNLTDLTKYEARAKAESGNIKIGGTLVSDAVLGDDAGEKSNIYLIGTAANPVEINGTVVVRGNVIIAGVVKGQGAIYASGNVYVPNQLSYENPPTTARPADNTKASLEAWISDSKDKDFLGLFAGENVVVGDHTNSTWRAYVGGWLRHSMNMSKEDSGEDLIPNTKVGKDGIAGTADDDVLEGDGLFTTEVYTTADQVAGLIPPGKVVGDPIPGTGEDIDGDGRFDDTIGLSDLDIPMALNSGNWAGNIPSGTVNYSTIASRAITRLDGVFYTNHAFAFVTLPSSAPIHINGSIVSRNESIVYSTQVHMNYDCRLLGGEGGLGRNLLPETVAPLKLVSWSLLDFDPNAPGVN